MSLIPHQNLGDDFYDVVHPADFPETVLRYRNDRAAASISLESLSKQDWLKHFGRFEPLPNNLETPLALRYHGHQFRHYNADLGDGRGFLFAQLKAEDGRLLDLGTKGSGQTPWSRAGDGRLTLKGGVREILATEMLEALGVTTSKTLSIIETGEALTRSDEPSPTRSAVMVRLNHSHIRFGTFQYLAYHNRTDDIVRLIDHSVRYYFPHLQELEGDMRVMAFFGEVISRSARLAAEWLAAGFVHGVLNTDNMTITGESFDYGPWRF
ncbi:MAG: protein adenylyltransferase SelO family protein, partial [Parvularculaceae bacterium]